MYDLPPRRRTSLILVKLGPAHTGPVALETAMTPSECHPKTPNKACNKSRSVVTIDIFVVAFETSVIFGTPCIRTCCPMRQWLERQADPVINQGAWWVNP